jgi:hypothetical protein
MCRKSVAIDIEQATRSNSPPKSISRPIIENQNICCSGDHRAEAVFGPEGEAYKSKALRFSDRIRNVDVRRKIPNSVHLHRSECETVFIQSRRIERNL